MTKQAYSNWLKIPQEILNGIDSVWFTWRKKERFQKRREFLFMCWLNKVQVNDMEKQFWKSSIYQHYCIRDVMRLPINGVSHYFSLSTNLFNNHICSYERKYCCFIKPLNSANKCFAPILTWKKFGPLGWLIYKVIEERRATITISDRQMQDYLKRLDLYLFFWINCYWNLGLSWNWTEAKDFLRNQEILSDNSVISGRNSVCRWSKVCTVRENDGSWAFWIRAGNQKEKQNSCQGIFNSIFRFLSIREFGIWKLYRTAAFWLSDF